ncbi:hypothetical protein [Nocardioides acrostichi]|uniref:Uncharacterized protein n=1 Tax=Nocardioides acrostichi TaxID=2784339 RepID=A0A930Y4J0_9ACTN|nr:hypothetical protein [Nocardioides acrostichi]MBF4160235.1 hypothetical protein [Nocardioides acrostichi]
MIRGLSRPVDPVSAPFAWEPDDEGRPALVAPRVTQCALSRICGACGESLGRPVAFLGDDLETRRNAFHAPPLHEQCAHGLLDRHPGTHIVLTSGFDFIRPHKDDTDRRPVFVPNSPL